MTLTLNGWHRILLTLTLELLSSSLQRLQRLQCLPYPHEPQFDRYDQFFFRSSFHGASGAVVFWWWFHTCLDLTRDIPTTRSAMDHSICNYYSADMVVHSFLHELDLHYELHHPVSTTATTPHMPAVFGSLTPRPGY